MKVYVCLIILISLGNILCIYTITTENNCSEKIQIDEENKIMYSKSFDNGGYIFYEYTPKGTDFNPELHWDSNLIPSNTLSFALAVEDPDAPKGIWYH